MFRRGTLWESVLRVTREALDAGALQPIPTAFEFVEDAGVAFVVRMVTSLAGKRNRLRETSEASAIRQNPFLPYDPRMFVAGVSRTHVCLLNKYNVVAHHVLLVTREFEAQESRLTLDDFRALWTCLAELDGLGFYNSGAAAGASQPHKHLQIVPLPLSPHGPALPVEPLLKSAANNGGIGRTAAFTFAHAVAPVAWTSGCSPLQLARATLAQYDAMLCDVGAAPAGRKLRRPAPYNLLVTRRWMLLVPRSTEFFGSISLNALAFAGALLVRNQQQLAELKQHGPMAALKHVAMPSAEEGLV